MKHDVYKEVEKAERGWWNKGRSASLTAVLNRITQDSSIPKGSVLDVGAGYGAMYEFLHTYGPVTAYEIYPDCITACKKRGYNEVFISEAELNETQTQFAVIGAFDVIEHIKDDLALMQKLHHLLIPSGILVLNVPAHQFLFGTYDTNAHHFRRYNKKTLSNLAEESGFELCYLGYWNFLLFFPAALSRLLHIGGAEGLNPNPIIDKLFTAIVYTEAFVLRFIKLPIGLSLIAVLRKKS